MPKRENGVKLTSCRYFGRCIQCSDRFNSEFLKILARTNKFMGDNNFKLVTALCKTSTLPRLSVIFCDNYFTSFNLFQNPHRTLGVKCTGTVQSNDIGGAPKECYPTRLSQLQPNVPYGNCRHSQLHCVTSVQKVCRDGNVRNAKFSCV